MFDHMHLRVADLSGSKRFYLAILAALERPESINDADDHLEVGPLYIDLAQEGTPSRVHVAFVARDRAMVEAFHRQGLAAGGRDNGAPGLRHYGPDYFAAFLLDPDGNNIEAVFHGVE